MEDVVWMAHSLSLYRLYSLTALKLSWRTSVSTLVDLTLLTIQGYDHGASWETE